MLSKSPENTLLKSIFYLALILSITYSVYIPAGNAKLTNWDDADYITNNIDITSFEKYGDNLLTKDYQGNYHPLTMLSYAFDYSIDKLNPKVYHLMNIIIHLINSALVFWLITLLAKNMEIGLLCGILFGIHPLNVESVAWVSERKNVLYSLFFLSSLIAYIKYLKNYKLKFYLFTLVLFILSLLSKGMAAPLSITLIAIDYLFGRKLLSKKVLVEKIPFITLSIVFGVIAVHLQPIDIAEVDLMENDPIKNPFYEKILYAVFNIGEYVTKFFIPLKLAAYYPYPPKDHGVLPLQYYVIPFIVIVFLATSVILLLKSKKPSSKLILFSLSFFLINIALVLQLLPVGGAIMADRYVYIPSIGIFLLLGVICKLIIDKKPWLQGTVIAALMAFCFWLSYLSFHRCEVWHDSLSLWTDEIEKYPDQGFGYNNRGLAKYDLKDWNGAMEDYNNCIKIEPPFYKAYYNKGILESTLGNDQAALNDFQKTIRINKYYPDVYLQRGIIKYKFKDYEGAVKDYSIYIGLSPLNPQGYNLRGFAKFNLSDYVNAINDYNKAIELAPYYAGVYMNRSMAKAQLNDITGAKFDINKAIEINPSYNQAYYSRAKLNFFLGLQKEACDDLQKAAAYGHLKAGEEINMYCK